MQKIVPIIFLLILIISVFNSEVKPIVSSESSLELAMVPLLTPTPAPTPECGNGIVEPPEQCDDENTVSGDGCSSTCQNEFCGDGIIQPALDEQCDDGNNNDGDGCSSICQNEFCGDGITQPTLGEQCDDGNNNDGDGCSAACLIEDGGGSSTSTSSTSSSTSSSSSSSGQLCEPPCEQPCGDYPLCIENCPDEQICAPINEKCICVPPGEGLNCTSTFHPACGSGMCPSGQKCVQDADTILCTCVPSGMSSSTSGSTGGGGVCGNGIVESPEECDDGNTTDDDECRNNCTLPYCGDGILDFPLEECDDGNNIDDGCFTCQIGLPPICGDGIIQTGEQCDDGNTSDNDGCSYICENETPLLCGDNIIESGEQCDDGNTTDNDGCSSTCILEICSCSDESAPLLGINSLCTDCLLCCSDLVPQDETIELPPEIIGLISDVIEIITESFTETDPALRIYALKAKVKAEPESKKLEVKEIGSRVKYGKISLTGNFANRIKKITVSKDKDSIYIRFNKKMDFLKETKSPKSLLLIVSPSAGGIKN